MKDLESLYENMLVPSLLKVVRQTFPLSPVKSEEGELEDSDVDVSETDEDEEEHECCAEEIKDDLFEIAKDLDTLAKDAMYKSFKKKIERCAERIRDAADKIGE